mmetsp:Transcript_11299/g.28570  ORF Transcript_11299/g.28570 Transcript_11299/m.28570 type:complete len:371 (+) Transcript_11299:265-1377(+)
MSKSPSLRRIQADIRELALDPSDQYYAHPLENDMFEWHFTIRGAEGTDFEGGIYHGRILLPPEYPYKPPHIVFLTPSGRFETNTKICLSFSAFHPELWQPAWGIRLILEALISFLPTPGDGAIGALDYKPEERRKLAKQSQSFCCPVCGPVEKLLPKLDPEKKKSSKSGESAFSKQIAELQRLQQQRERGKKRTAKAKSEKPEETTTAASKTPPGGEAESKDTTEGAKSEQVPELSSDAENDNTKKVGSSTIKESEDEAVPLADRNDATVDENNNIPTVEDEPQSLAAVDNRVEGEVEGVVNGFSNLYDPLLNVSILLMLCICVLLLQKAMDLYQELNELRATPIVDTLMEKATSAASSVAASAASSDEL